MGDHERRQGVVIATSDFMSVHKTVFTPANSLIPALLAACLSLGLSSVAAAAPPAGGTGGAGPEEEACGGRGVGDACTLPNRALGTCKAGTCNRLDYSGGSPPKAVEQACVVCQPGASRDGPPALGSGGAPPDDGGEGGNAGEGDDAGESARTSSGKEPPQSSSRCRVDPDGGGLGMLGLLGVLGLFGNSVLSLRRRRRPGS